MIDKIKAALTIDALASRLGMVPNKSGFINSLTHQEKTPSLKLYPPDTWYDYSNNTGGDIIDFYRAWAGCDVGTAVRELAGIAGISTSLDNRGAGISPSAALGNRDQGAGVRDQETGNRKQRLIECLTEREKELYYERLEMAGEEQALYMLRQQRLEKNSMIFQEFEKVCMEDGWDFNALMYLREQRGFSNEVIKRFRFFYVFNYFHVTKRLKKLFSESELKLCGLFNDKGNLIFSYHKIIIPYLWRGKIIYLRGRVMPDASEDKFSKYMGLRNDALNVNSCKRFYNWDALEKALPGERIYITEGEFDAVAVEQMGYNAIGVPGAANLPAKMDIIKHKKFEIVYLGDNDAAGNGLKERLREQFKKMNIPFLWRTLPEGCKDANDFLRLHGNQ